ncbi:MAG: 3-phosphoshikimate 1-carboxyvinyltransferase [Clostridiales bacterium]|nr:3-phosphoshikimate 1-carboxyvinyltransferase [Clostridiales bacterium]
MDVRITPSPMSGAIRAIASKSYAHRALICAALADSDSFIRLNTVSKDIEATVECLMSLGARISREDGVTRVTPIKEIKDNELFCNESGSTLRFLLPVAAALKKKTVFTASGKLPERPLSPLKEEMERHGVSFSDSFPLEISGFLKSGEFVLEGNVSSQFVSGLLFALPLLFGDSVIKLIPPVESKPYIDMTVEVLRQFGIEITQGFNSYSVPGNQTYKKCDYTVEGDWSNAAYFLAMGVRVTGLDLSSTQGDRAFLEIMHSLGADVDYQGEFLLLKTDNLHGGRIDARNIPDLVPLLAAVTATAKGRTEIINAGRLRLKESDRLVSTFEMLKNLGADIEKTDDGFIIQGVERLKGGTVDSYNDHRIVMSAAVASLKCENEVYIKDAIAVAKSYPTFFEDFNSAGGNAQCL